MSTDSRFASSSSRLWKITSTVGSGSVQTVAKIVITSTLSHQVNSSKYPTLKLFVYSVVLQEKFSSVICVKIHILADEDI